MRTRIAAALVVLAACKGGETKPPVVAFTPDVEARLSALGGECKQLRRISGDPKAAPNVLQCQGTTSYLSVNFDEAAIVSIELALTGTPAELRAGYARALDKLAPAEALTWIQTRLADNPLPIDSELGKAGGLSMMMMLSKQSNTVFKADVTLNWR